MRLILALILAAGVAYGQTTVNITNSLIGPVTQNFSNTQVNVTTAVITGAVVNASVTGAVINASITNSFAPINNVTNEISITNEVTVGGTTVNNTNSFVTYITNQVTVAGVIITNIIENIVQSNSYFITSGVSSISFTGAVDGAITFAGNAVTQTNKTFNFSFTDLGFTNIVTAGSGNVITNLIGTGRTITQQLGTVSGGGGLVYLQETNGAATQAGAFLFPTQNISALTFGIFIATNNSMSVNRPDGTSSGGNARGNGSIDLQIGFDGGSVYPRVGATEIVSGPRSFMAASTRGTISSASPYNVILGGRSGTSQTISGGEGNLIISGPSTSITGGDNQFSIGNASGGTINGTAGNGFLGTSGSVGNGTLQGYSTVVIGSDGLIGVGSGSFNSVILASRYANITGTVTAAQAYNIMGAGQGLTNSSRDNVLFGSYIKNDHRGNFIWRGWDGSTTTFASAQTNRVLFQTGAFGINTNNPQQALHVAGAIRADTAYHLGANAGITVTQKFLDASSNIRTNIFIGGILVTGYTE